MNEELPRAIQAILNAEEKLSVAQVTVSHRLELNYDGVSVATFESDGPIQLPSVGSTVTVHHVEVIVTEVELEYAVLDGVPSVTANVEVEPA